MEENKTDLIALFDAVIVTPIEEEESTEPIRTVDVNNMHMP